ncbi:MAG: response regulator [Actinobacteria bacterium]|nr:response regulator [Actinomycetota bacterium]
MPAERGASRDDEHHEHGDELLRGADPLPSPRRCTSLDDNTDRGCCDEAPSPGRQKSRLLGAGVRCVAFHVEHCAAPRLATGEYRGGGLASCVFLEDHELVLEAVRAGLVGHFGSLDVVYAGPSTSGAREAMRHAQVDFILMDLDLGDGQRAESNVALMVGSGAPVIIVSALVDGETVRRSLEAGAIGYVSKQGRFEELVQAVEAGMQGEQYMSPDIAKALVGSRSIRLSEQERTALTLYASGLKLSAVARRMAVSESTVNEYIKRVRGKYARAGTPVPTKVHLYRVAQSEGWLE